MKSSHCMLNQTQSNCETSQAKETPEHYLLEKDREVLFKIIKKKYKKKKKPSQYIITLTVEDVLGEQNIMHDDHKSLREAFEKYINSTKKDFSNFHWFMMFFHFILNIFIHSNSYLS